VKRDPTRAAVVTPPGEGGIGIIAVVGPGAVDVLDAVFVGTRRSIRRLGVGQIAHGLIRRGRDVLDEVIVARLDGAGPGPAGPRFEVNCHGGPAAVQAVLGALQQAGAELTDWRRLAAQAAPEAPVLATDAIRARALAALPAAPTRVSAAMLLHQADGALSRELDAVEGALRAGQADVAGGRLESLLRTAPLGGALLRPPRVGLFGPPNVGKSTLLNALLRRERVIVHHEPGTTRDIVTETVSVGGVPFELADCAGIRRAEDEIEREAVARAGALARSCDVALLVFDARVGPAPDGTNTPPLRPGARAILVGNKVDLLGGDQPPSDLGREPPLLYISAARGENLELLESALLAPYDDLLKACRAGGPVLFDAEAETAVRRVLAALLRDGSAEALRELTACRRHE